LENQPPFKLKYERGAQQPKNKEFNGKIKYQKCNKESKTTKTDKTNKTKTNKDIEQG
jgi:hypothetical protein